MSVQKRKILSSSKSGFTLVEVLVTAGVVVVVLTGLMQLFIYCRALADMAANTAFAVTEAQDKMEEIRNTSYDLITTNYVSGGTPGNIFSLGAHGAVGSIYIDSSNSDLLRVDVSVGWRNINGRVIGEDLDLDGDIDAGEDVNGNSKLDSPVMLSTSIARK